jgi:dTDP-glucose 4,6-dehydratase
MNKNLLLTGCAGFIGLNFLKELKSIRKNYKEIISIDRIDYASEYNIEEYRKVCAELNIIRIDSDINKLNSDIMSLLSFDVVNFASGSHVTKSLYTSEVYKENVLLVPNLIDKIGLKNINTFYQISTDEVYGEIELEKTDMEYWFTPQHQLIPNNPYSASKASQDLYLNAMRHSYGMNVRYIRLANQFGPHQHPEKMFPKSILRAFGGQPILIHGDGRHIRQWTPVVRSVKVIKDYITGVLPEREVLHIAMDQPLESNLEVVKEWCTILKNDFNLSATFEFIPDRNGNDLMYALKTDNDVKPYFYEKPIMYEFKDTIQFYKDNLGLYNRENSKHLETGTL